MSEEPRRRPRAARDEAEAAYFTLLRARDELDGLRRYEEALHEEQQRLTRFEREGESVARRAGYLMRRPLRHSEELLADAVRARRAVVADELERLPDRQAAAEAFVAECEREHDALR